MLRTNHPWLANLSSSYISHGFHLPGRLSFSQSLSSVICPALCHQVSFGIEYVHDCRFTPLSLCRVSLMVKVQLFHKIIHHPMGNYKELCHATADILVNRKVHHIYWPDYETVLETQLMITVYSNLYNSITCHAHEKCQRAPKSVSVHTQHKGFTRCMIYG